MKDGLYHRNIYWHAEFDNFFEDHKIDKINLTRHVKENQYTEGKRVYDFSDITLDFLKKGIIIEVEILEGDIKKILVRNKYKAGNDICTALAVHKNELNCKTCYLNHQEDEHYNLNPDKYITAEEDEKEEATTPTTTGATIADMIRYKNERNKKR